MGKIRFLTMPGPVVLITLSVEKERTVRRPMVIRRQQRMVEEIIEVYGMSAFFTEQRHCNQVGTNNRETWLTFIGRKEKRVVSKVVSKVTITAINARPIFFLQFIPKPKVRPVPFLCGEIEKPATGKGKVTAFNVALRFYKVCFGTSHSTA